MSATDSDHLSLRSRWLFTLIIIAFLAWAFTWIAVYEPEHDEVEHWHAAWLMFQGKAPYADFFEHHTPLLWEVIRLYYRFFGENYGVIIITRLLMLIAFSITALTAYRIARRWTSPEGAFIAALGFPLFNLSLLQAHLFVRGDPLILMLLMISLYHAVKVSESDRWGRPEVLRLVLIFILLGVALGFSPRAGIPSLTIFLLLFFFGLRAIRPVRAVWLFLIGGIIVLIPTLWLALLYNPDYYLFWVFKFSASLYPSFSPLGYLIRLVVTAFPLWFLAGAFLFHVAFQRRCRLSRGEALVVILAVVNFFGLWANSRPYAQHFLMTVPFFGLLAGMGYDVLFRCWLQKWNLSRLNWAGILLLIGLLLTFCKSYRIWFGGDMEPRSYWVERASWLVRNAGENGTFAAGMAYFQPIFLDDALYYWFGGRYVAPTMDRLNRNLERYTPQALRVTRPAIIHESIADAWGFKYDDQYRAWLRNHYDPTPYDRYWIRKDLSPP